MLLAQLIQLLQMQTMHFRLASMTADLIRETAHKQGDAFEGHQSDPVMGVRHVELEQRLR